MIEAKVSYLQATVDKYICLWYGTAVPLEETLDILISISRVNRY